MFSDVNRKKKKCVHPRAEFEPMQMACSAPPSGVTGFLAEASPRLALRRVSVAARLADGFGSSPAGRSLSYVTAESIIRFSWDIVSPYFK